MELIAHAGWSGEYVANTIPSLCRAAKAVDMIEIDLHICGSGEVVLFHDDTLERAADDPRPINEVPWEELREVPLFGTDERIPLLVNALEAIPADIGLNLEFKHSGLAAPVKELTAEYDHDLLVSSFHEDAIREVDELDWDVDTGYLFEAPEEAGVRTATNLDCEFIHPHFQCCLESDVVSEARKSDLGVNVWTVTERDVFESMEAQGVDGIIIDCDEILEGEETTTP